MIIWVFEGFWLPKSRERSCKKNVTAPNVLSPKHFCCIKQLKQHHGVTSFVWPTSYNLCSTDNRNWNSVTWQTKPITSNEQDTKASCIKTEETFSSVSAWSVIELVNTSSLRQCERPLWYCNLAYGIWYMKSIMVNIDRWRQFVSIGDWDWYTCPKWLIGAED